jgi:hypothetical protein
MNVGRGDMFRSAGFGERIPHPRLDRAAELNGLVGYQWLVTASTNISALLGQSENRTDHRDP